MLQSNLVYESESLMQYATDSIRFVITLWKHGTGLTSCSRGPGLKSRLGKRLSSLRFFVVFLIPSDKCRDNTLN
jgi:hypothetical protein